MPQLTELLETAVGSIAPRFDVADVEARAVRFRRARRFRALVAGAVVVVVLVGTLVSWNSSSSPRVSISSAGGTVLGVATNTVLMVDDYDGVVLIDLDGRVVVRRQWDGQAPGDRRYRLIRLGDSLVGVGLGGAGRVSGAYATPLDGKPSQLLDGEAWDYVPAAEPGRVWVLGRPGGTPGADSITAREVDVHGKVRLEHRIEPSQGVAMIGIPGGLALQAASGGINLFDASTGTITAHLGGHAPAFAHAVHAATLVWCDVCTTLHLTTIGGTDLPVAAPAGSTGFEPDATAFSPDGRYVAAISWEGPPYATGTTEDLVVIDTATGASRVVASLGEYASVPAWSSDSVHLFVMTSNDYNARAATVVMYNMGTHALRTGTVPVGVSASVAVEHDKVASLLEVPTGRPEQCLQVKNIPPTQTMPCGYRF